MDSEQYRLSKNLIYLRQAGSECSVNIYLNNTRRGLTQARNTFGNIKQAPYNKESSQKLNGQTKYRNASNKRPGAYSRQIWGHLFNKPLSRVGLIEALRYSRLGQLMIEKSTIFSRLEVYVTRQSSAINPIYCNLLNLWLFYRKKRSSNLFSWQRYLPTTCNYQPHENHETIVFCHQTFDLIWSMIDGCVGILLLPRCVALIFALCNFDESFDHNI